MSHRKIKNGSKHHIVPKSRLKGKELIAYIHPDSHRLYHQLFSNRTPEEIIRYLVEYFWDNHWEFVDRAKK